MGLGDARRGGERGGTSKVAGVVAPAEGEGVAEADWHCGCCLFIDRVGVYCGERRGIRGDGVGDVVMGIWVTWRKFIIDETII